MSLSEFKKLLANVEKYNKPQDMCILGYAYYKGLGTEKNLELAFYWLKKAAEAGDDLAMRNLAALYRNGEGTEINNELAMEWMHKYSIAAKYTEIENTSPHAYFQNQLFLSQMGDGEAMEKLYILYSSGYGVKKDEKIAFDWLCKAALNNVPAAIHNLAIHYLFGISTEQNVDEFIKWIKKAAENNGVKAMYLLSKAYKHGIGIEKNLNAAFELLEKAAESGDTLAIADLAIAYLYGIGTEPNYDRFKEWLGKAVERNCLKAILLNSLSESINEVEKIKLLWDSLFKLIKVIDKIKKGHSVDVNEHDKVGHFTKIEALRSILKLDENNLIVSDKNHLRLYDVAYMNDPSEGLRLIQYEKESNLLSEYFDESDFGINEDKDISVYVCSLSYNTDALELWRGYGNDGNGYSIVIPINSFKTNQFTNNIEVNDILEDLCFESLSINTESLVFPQDEYNEQLRLYSIKYDDEEVRQTLKKLDVPLREIKERISDLDGQQKKAVRKLVQSIVRDIIYLYKNKDYHFEKEARLIQVLPITSPSLKLDERNPPRVYVESPNFLFSGLGSKIIIGPKVADKTILEKEIRFRLARLPYKNTTTVEHSIVKYR